MPVANEPRSTGWQAVHEADHAAPPRERLRPTGGVEHGDTGSMSRNVTRARDETQQSDHVTQCHTSHGDFAASVACGRRSGERIDHHPGRRKGGRGPRDGLAMGAPGSGFHRRAPVRVSSGPRPRPRPDARWRRSGSRPSRRWMPRSGTTACSRRDPGQPVRCSSCSAPTEPRPSRQRLPRKCTCGFDSMRRSCGSARVNSMRARPSGVNAST